MCNHDCQLCSQDCGPASADEVEYLLYETFDFGPGELAVDSTDTPRGCDVCPYVENGRLWFTSGFNNVQAFDLTPEAGFLLDFEIKPTVAKAFGVYAWPLGNEDMIIRFKMDQRLIEVVVGGIPVVQQEWSPSRDVQNWRIVVEFDRQIHLFNDGGFIAAVAGAPSSVAGLNFYCDICGTETTWMDNVRVLGF